MRPLGWCLGIVVAISLLSMGGMADATTGLVRRSGRSLTLNGHPLYVHGVNQYHLFYKPPEMVDEVLRHAVWFGGNTYVRTWAFCNGVSAEGFCFQPQPRVYDETTFRKLDFVLARANHYELRVVLPLVNNWDDFGGMNQYVAWCGVTSGGHDAFYTNACAKQLYKDYVRHVLSRVNTITGVPYKNDPAILAWQLANEPSCESDPTGNTLHAWIQEMAAYVKSLDPNHLVSTGEEGWYTSKGSDWRHNGSKGADFLRDSAVTDVDIASFNLYPEPYALDEPGAVGWIDEHVHDAHDVVHKPVLLGEFGWRVPRQLLGGFSVGTETWRVDWGFHPASPQRVANPSEDGNGALCYTGTVPAGGSAAGERRFPGPGLNVSGLDLLRMVVYLPIGAPAGLQAVLYTKSGPNWVWREGSTVSLAPGGWTTLTFPVASAFQPSAIHSVGVKLFNGARHYSGGLVIDGVSAISTQPGRTLADRERVYRDWYRRLDVDDADGAMVWILYPHEPDTTWMPNYDGYGVYVPEDQPMLQRMQEYSARMAQKSTLSPDAFPTVTIQKPASGETVKGLVTIVANATDKQGVAKVSYSVDGGSPKSMVGLSGNLWQAVWDSTGTPNGTHLLTVEATNSTGLSKGQSQSVTVQAANSPANILYVKWITMALGQRGGKRQAVATVAVVDGQQRPVGGVTVFTRWSGAATDRDVITTNAAGVTGQIFSNETPTASGVFRITVEHVTKNGSTYLPALNIETSDQISF